MGRSTAGLLQQRLAEIAPGLEAQAIYLANQHAWRWARERRGAEEREVPALERFTQLCASLGLPGDPALVQELLDLHMAASLGAFTFPEPHRALLEGLRPHYRLAILSNFDYAPPLRTLLRQQGISAWFDPIVISAEIGYRKPGRQAFRHALDRAGFPPREVLFVGDSLSDDVAGARAAGLDVAWINRAREARAGAEPTYELTDLAQLAALL